MKYVTRPVLVRRKQNITESLSFGRQDPVVALNSNLSYLKLYTDEIQIYYSNIHLYTDEVHGSYSDLTLHTDEGHAF